MWKLLALGTVARGAVGLLLPRTLARLAGVGVDATRTRWLFGVREVVIGVGLYRAAPPPSTGCWPA